MPQEKTAWEVLGHEPVTRFFDAAISRDRLHHAYILEGPAHVGKRTVARQLAASLLNVDPKALDAHPDVVLVARKLNEKTKKMRESIVIDQIHEARGRFGRSSFSGGYKVMMIEDAHRMSTGAANALLKTLEEPRGKAIMILTTTDASKLLPTIRSRGQLLRLHRLDENRICNWLQEIDVDLSTAQESARLARGCPGFAKILATDEERRREAKEDEDRALACLTARIPQRILAARTLIPSYQDDHVKTRGQLKNRIDVLESVARRQLIDGSGELDAPQLAQALRSISQLKKDLSFHLNPHVSLINAMLF